MLVKTLAIVLKVIKHGDSSKIATLHTQSHGLITVIAKGARNNKNKFGSALEPLSIIETTFYFKPNTDLFLLSSAENIVPVRKLQSSVEFVLHGLVIAESVLATQPKNSTNEHINEMLIEYLQILNNLDCEPFSVLTKFLIELANEMGFIAEIKVPQELSASYYHIDLTTGSLSSYQTERTIRMSYESIQYIQTITNGRIKEVKNEIISDKFRYEVFSYIIRYISYHMDKKFVLKSASLLNYG